MTGNYVEEKALAEAERWLNFHETDNNCQPFSLEQYGVRCPGGGWCCSYSSHVTIAGGYIFDSHATYGPRGFSFTDAARDWAKVNGLWRDPAWQSAPADWWIFDWNGDGRTDHVEVNEHDDGHLGALIGGNTGNAVKHNLRDRKYLHGIIAFSESDQTTPPFDVNAAQAAVQLLKLEEDVAADPLRRGQVRREIAPVKQILAKRGLLVITSKTPMNVFDLAMANAVAHGKRIRGDESPKGGVLGGDFMRWLLTPK